MAGDESFAVSLELLRRGHDIHAMVKAMADRLERALPDQVNFTASRLRRRTALEIQLVPEQFRIEVLGQRAGAQIDHIVRGICVRSEDVDIDTWLERLGTSLEREAAKSTTIRLALDEALS
ncbi:MAG: hypothetical protein H0U92_02135 [Actinobacteria bacterium]|nr:hypothetical protein [Actinomycetota bacterium]